MKHESNPKSTKVDAFERKICNNPSHNEDNGV